LSRRIYPQIYSQPVHKSTKVIHTLWITLAGVRHDVNRIAARPPELSLFCSFLYVLKGEFGSWSVGLVVSPDRIGRSGEDCVDWASEVSVLAPQYRQENLLPRRDWRVTLLAERLVLTDSCASILAPNHEMQFGFGVPTVAGDLPVNLLLIHSITYLSY
jgi:hypothetical protein